MLCWRDAQLVKCSAEEALSWKNTQLEEHIARGTLSLVIFSLKKF